MELPLRSLVEAGLPKSILVVTTGALKQGNAAVAPIAPARISHVSIGARMLQGSSARQIKHQQSGSLRYPAKHGSETKPANIMDQSCANTVMIMLA